MEPAAQAAMSDHILKGNLEISPQRKGRAFSSTFAFVPMIWSWGLNHSRASRTPTLLVKSRSRDPSLPKAGKPNVFSEDISSYLWKCLVWLYAALQSFVKTAGYFPPKDWSTMIITHVVRSRNKLMYAFFIDCCSYNLPFVHRWNKNRGDNWPGGDYVDCCSYLGVKRQGRPEHSAGHGNRVQGMELWEI